MFLSPPPYADPLAILVAKDVIPITVPPVAIPSETSSYRLIKICLLSCPIISIFIHLLYQIILAGFNCRLEDSNLGWIRASFFLNIPLLLCGFIFIIRNWKKQKTILFLEFTETIVFPYASSFFLYWIGLGIYFEIDELAKIRGLLRNETNISLLPCSKTYYYHVFYLEITHFCSLIIYPLLFILFGYFIQPGSLEGETRCDQLLKKIVKKWRFFSGIIFQRHQGEIVIE